MPLSLSLPSPFLSEVIGALIAHIGNGIRSEVDHALDIILSLLEHNFKSMHRFSVFIKVGHMVYVHVTVLVTWQSHDSALLYSLCWTLLSSWRCRRSVNSTTHWARSVSRWQRRLLPCRTRCTPSSGNNWHTLKQSRLWRLNLKFWKLQDFKDG